ncbi:ComF family protein [Amylibacter sp. SFDW26]|nr:ComF family protein [Amylibacter sp. SFDW26]
MACGVETENERGLCQSCWVDTHFATGQVCDSCGVPVPEGEQDVIHCDSCLSFPPAWDQGRCSVLYVGAGRKLALLLKHSDRLDLVPEMIKWMYASCASLLDENTVIIPVPLHRFRLLRRRFNQAAVLAQKLGNLSGDIVHVDALRRIKPTKTQKNMCRDERFKNLDQSMILNPRFKDRLKGKSVLLVDDVMTTGATLSACAEICRAAGAKKVNVVTFARVARPE